jgi:hypothetical protein
MALQHLKILLEFLFISRRFFFRHTNEVKIVCAKSNSFGRRVAVLPDQCCQMVYFKPKIPIWGYFGGPWNGKCWCILRPFWYDSLPFLIVYIRFV